MTLHNNLTLSKIENDPELVNELDFALCLDRAATLLMPPTPPPTQQAREEAERFLSLVEQKKPAYSARVDYLRVISLMHAKEYDAGRRNARRDCSTPRRPAITQASASTCCSTRGTSRCGSTRSSSSGSAGAK